MLIRPFRNLFVFINVALSFVLLLLTLFKYRHANYSSCSKHVLPHSLAQMRPNFPIYTEEVLIFVITPTYRRTTQRPDMIRLAQTLRLVPNIFWIVVEDARVKTPFISTLLTQSGIPYAHLVADRPVIYDNAFRGVTNRLKAFQWIRKHYSGTNQSGVLYLADDDNTYDVRLFEEIRPTKVVSMFPIGGILGYGISSPVVDLTSGKIIGFHDAWDKGRNFAVDMASFAVNLQFFLSKKNATMDLVFQEDSFLRSLDIQFSDLEARANGCTDVLVWHTQTVKMDPVKSRNMQKVPNVYSSNIPLLYRKMLE